MNISMRCSPLLAIAFSLGLIMSSTSCGENTGVLDPSERLCRGGSGFGARIMGAMTEIDMCVSNDNVATRVGRSNPNRYDLQASFQEDSITVDINISFLAHVNLPAALTVTGDAAAALADPDGAWFSYTEARIGSYSYQSSTVAGTLTLTFSDTTVAVGTFDNLEITLEDAMMSTVGTRTISEGYFVVTPTVTAP